MRNIQAKSHNYKLFTGSHLSTNGNPRDYVMFCAVKMHNQRSFSLLEHATTKAVAMFWPVRNRKQDIRVRVGTWRGSPGRRRRRRSRRRRWSSSRCRRTTFSRFAWKFCRWNKEDIFLVDDFLTNYLSLLSLLGAHLRLYLLNLVSFSESGDTE